MPLSRHSGPGNGLKCNSLGKIRPQSSQLAESLWTDPGINGGISVRELISTLKKKAQAGNEWSKILKKILASEEKATTTTLNRES